MKQAEKLKREASKLVDKLQNDITTGRRQIVENYGQKEIRKFEEKELLNNNLLSYSEKYDILAILYKVASIS